MPDLIVNVKKFSHLFLTTMKSNSYKAAFFLSLSLSGVCEVCHIVNIFDRGSGRYIYISAECPVMQGIPATREHDKFFDRGLAGDEGKYIEMP